MGVKDPHKYNKNKEKRKGQLKFKKTRARAAAPPAEFFRAGPAEI